MCNSKDFIFTDKNRQKHFFIKKSLHSNYHTHRKRKNNKNENLSTPTPHINPKKRNRNKYHLKIGADEINKRSSRFSHKRKNKVGRFEPTYVRQTDRTKERTTSAKASAYIHQHMCKYMCGIRRGPRQY